MTKLEHLRCLNLYCPIKKRCGRHKSRGPLAPNESFMVFEHLDGRCQFYEPRSAGKSFGEWNGTNND